MEQLNMQPKIELNPLQKLNSEQIHQFKFTQCKTGLSKHSELHFPYFKIIIKLQRNG